MATIYDVAKEAGVSPKTVSRVLNEDAPVNARTRQTVMRAMDALGYVPSQAARMMRSNRSGIIGLITGAISRNNEPMLPTGLPDLYIVQAVQQVMSERGKILMIADTGGNPAVIPKLVRSFAQHRVEGLIYVAERHTRIDLDLGVDRCPLVLANCFDDAGHSAILPDDQICQRLLVNSLIAAGHHRIGFLTLDPVTEAARLRNIGYRQAHQAAGLPINEALMIPAQTQGQEMGSGLLTAALTHLLSLPDPPTVICCGNDEMAVRVYGILRTRGLRIPEDISVAGFDDNRAIAETLYPPLSTVELPYREMGRQAAEMVLRQVATPATAPQTPTLVAGPVIWRSSVTSLRMDHIKSSGRKTL